MFEALSGCFINILRCVPWGGGKVPPRPPRIDSRGGGAPAPLRPPTVAPLEIRLIQGYDCHRAWVGSYVIESSRLALGTTEKTSLRKSLAGNYMMRIMQIDT